MFLFISSFFMFSFVLFLWMLLIASNRFKSDEERFIEDNLQMEFLKNYCLNIAKENK